MQGSIAFDGTLSGSIAGGGGGGSEVTITPTLTEGEKIADYEIDGNQGELYAPTPTPLPDHIVNDIHGFSYTPRPTTEVASYTIDDGEEQSILTPDYTTSWEAYPGVDQDYTIGTISCYGSNYNVKIPSYQKPLVEGDNISINPYTNEISCTGIENIYSDDESLIGTFLGSDLYVRAYQVPNGVSIGNTNVTITQYIPNHADFDMILRAQAVSITYKQCVPLFAYISSYTGDVMVRSWFAETYDTIILYYTKQ